MGIGVTILTIVHVALSLAGIGSGFVVLYGLVAARRLESWTAFFLATTVATSVTGFLFPIQHFTPGLALAHHLADRAGSGDRRPLPISPRRGLAPGLCGQRGDRSIPECFRADRPALSESASSQIARTDSGRAAVPGDAGRCAGSVRSRRDCQRGSGFAPTRYGRPEQKKGSDSSRS